MKNEHLLLIAAGIGAVYFLNRQPAAAAAAPPVVNVTTPSPVVNNTPAAPADTTALQTAVDQMNSTLASILTRVNTAGTTATTPAR